MYRKWSDIDLRMRKYQPIQSEKENDCIPVPECYRRRKLAEIEPEMKPEDKPVFENITVREIWDKGTMDHFNTHI